MIVIKEPQGSITTGPKESVFFSETYQCLQGNPRDLMRAKKLSEIDPIMTSIVIGLNYGGKKSIKERNV